MEDTANPAVDNAADKPSDQPDQHTSSVQTSDKKTKQTTPTLNPDVEFVNRTLP